MEDGTVRSVCYGGILADYLTAETPAEQPPVSARNELLSDQPPLRRAYLEVCAAEYEWEFDPQSLREQVRLSPNIEQKRLIVALTDSLIDAEQADDYKTMDQIVSAGLSLLEKASDSLALRRLVGEAALLSEDYETAEDMLYGIEMYSEAFLCGLDDGLQR